MANTKISALTADTAPTADDLVVTVNDPGGTPATRKATITNFTKAIPAVIGDSGSGGTKGLVPAPAAGDAAANKFLHADGTFKAPAGSGSIGGSTGSTDNAVLRADGTGGSTAQSSAITVDDNGAVTVPEIAAPSTPASGKVAVYAKSDGKLYIKDDAGTETDLTATSSGTIGGSTGATDNALLRADGTGGSTLQASAITVDDNGGITVPEIAAPSTPASGKVVVYAKSDGLIYGKDDAGTETKLSNDAGSGYSTVQDEGVSVTQRSTLDFAGAGVSVIDSGGTKTLVTIPGGGGGGTVGTAVSWSQFDEEPSATAHADNEEMTAALDGAWTWQAQSGTPTNAALGNWHDTTNTEPTWNLNSDVLGALVIRPKSGEIFKVYRSWAPATGTRWMVAAKVRLCKSSGTTDRVMFTVANAAPSSSSETPTNGVSLWIENAGTNNGQDFKVQGEWRNGAGGLDVRTVSNYQGQTVYFAFVAKTDNYIYYYWSQDGLAWNLMYQIFSNSDLLTNTVTHVWISVRDGDTTNSQTPCIGIVEFIRFKTGSNNLWELSMAK